MEEPLTCELEKEVPEVFPVCAVTRSMTKVAAPSDYNDRSRTKVAAPSDHNDPPGVSSFVAENGIYG